MAVPYKPELFSVESVLDFYEGADGIHFKVFGGTSPKPEYCRYYFDGEDKQLGAEKLNDALIGLKGNTDNTNAYLLQVFKKPGRKKASAMVSDAAEATQIVFQLNKAERLLPYSMGMIPTQQTDPALTEAIRKMTETNNAILSKLSASEIEDEPEPEKKGFLGSILENEKFQEMAIMAISGILTKGFSGAMGSNNPTALAGIPGSSDEQQHKAAEALIFLSQRDPNYGDHLLYLSKIDDSKYNMLLSFIK